MDINYSFLGDNVCRPGKTIYASDKNTLFDCLKYEGDQAVNQLRAALRSGAELDQEYYGYTFLGAACCVGRYDLIEAVIDHVKQVILVLIH